MFYPFHITLSVSLPAGYIIGKVTKLFCICNHLRLLSKISLKIGSTLSA